jgi:nucleotide sugar dehydrogenase
MTKIGIIGYGFVGEAVEYGFKANNEIKIYDKYKNYNAFEETINDSEIIFICLPTPYKDNKIDLSIIDETIEDISKLAEDTNKIIVIKSTAIPGTTEKYSKKYQKLNFCFNPEFLREKHHLQDFINADRTVIGANNEEIKKRMIKLYKDNFPKIPIFTSDTSAAELSKYMANSFLATKVIFANEIYDLCQKLDINYEDVKEMVLADKRIGDSHFDVTKERGFGGKCFPKDLIAFLALFKSFDIDSSLLKTVHEKNNKIRKTKDWKDIPFVNSDNKNV